MYFKADGLPYSKKDDGSESQMLISLPINTKGDLFTWSTLADKLAVGSNGQLIFADSTQSVGLKWNTPTYTNLGLGSAATLAFDTDGTLSANSDSRIATQKAIKTYIDLSVTGILDFKGATDASGNPNYPAALKGDSYVISVAGKIGGASGIAVDVGDIYIAIADNAGGTQAAVGASWIILEHNLQGALLAANNLSDLANAATARTNLGLGSMAVVNSPAPVGNGGTGTSTAFTAGSVVFAGASGVYSQDNSKLFWDDTNFYLGIGTASPSAGLHILNATAANKLLFLKMAASQSGKVIEVQNSAGTILAQMDNQGFLGLAGASDPSVALIVAASNAIRYGVTSFTQLVSGATNSQINTNAGTHNYLVMGHATPFHGSIGTTTLFAKLGILPSATTQIGLAIRNIASQSANLVEFQDSAGTAMIFVDQAGNMQFKVAGKGIAIREGSNARMGVATLVGGTVTVTNTVPSASSRIFLSHATTGGVIGTLTYTISAGVSFTINSSAATDTSTVNWLIIDPS